MNNNITNRYNHCGSVWEINNCCSYHNDRCPICNKEIEPEESWYNYEDKPEKLKVFLIYYSGLWLGGKAVVLAYDKKSAYDYLKNDHSPKLGEFEDCNITEYDIKPGILYNDTGNY